MQLILAFVTHSDILIRSLANLKQMLILHSNWLTDSCCKLTGVCQMTGFMWLKRCKIQTPVSESEHLKTGRLRDCNFIKKRLWHRCFPVKFPKFFLKTYIAEHLWTTFRCKYHNVIKIVFGADLQKDDYNQ